jgi:hypothetical protein
MGCSPASQAGMQSLPIIKTALQAAATDLKASPRAPWHRVFYQLANRIAHLWFLRDRGVNAHLVLVNFTNVAEVNGPASADEWRAAYQVVWYVLGLHAGHMLSRHTSSNCTLMFALWRNQTTARFDNAVLIKLSQAALGDPQVGGGAAL